MPPSYNTPLGFYRIFLGVSIPKAAAYVEPTFGVWLQCQELPSG
jgi:hypothetical protein